MAVEERDFRVSLVSLFDLINFSTVETPHDGHAGEVETSLMMVIRPDLVKGRPEEHFPRRPRFMIMKDVRHLMGNGIMGNPQPASPEKGRRYFQMAVDGVKAALFSGTAGHAPQARWPTTRIRPSARAPGLAPEVRGYVQREVRGATRYLRSKGNSGDLNRLPELNTSFRRGTCPSTIHRDAPGQPGGSSCGAWREAGPGHRSGWAEDAGCESGISGGSVRGIGKTGLKGVVCVV